VRDCPPPLVGPCLVPRPVWRRLQTLVIRLLAGPFSICLLICTSSPPFQTFHLSPSFVSRNSFRFLFSSQPLVLFFLAPLQIVDYPLPARFLKPLSRFLIRIFSPLPTLVVGAVISAPRFPTSVLLCLLMSLFRWFFSSPQPGCLFSMVDVGWFLKIPSWMAFFHNPFAPPPLCPDDVFLALRSNSFVPLIASHFLLWESIEPPL